MTQAHNVFQNNTVGGYTDTNARSEEYFGGGGEYAQITTITSFDDTFIGNSVGAGVGNDTGAGGGFALQGFPGGTTSTLHATNLVATNNSVTTAADGDADGGGIYAGFLVGCSAGSSCPAQVDLFDSTITANSASSGPGMAGGTVADIGHVTNSIVYGNTGNAAQLDFTNLAVTYSDSCSAAATAYSGTGNICVNPALVNPAGNDVHETAASPTVNAGNNALIPAGVTTDYMGNARIIDGTVDMGAAEFRAAATVIPPVPASGAAAGPVLQVGLTLMTLGALLLGLIGFGVLAAPPHAPHAVASGRGRLGPGCKRLQPGTEGRVAQAAAAAALANASRPSCQPSWLPTMSRCRSQPSPWASSLLCSSTTTVRFGPSAVNVTATSLAFAGSVSSWKSLLMSQLKTKRVGGSYSSTRAQWDSLPSVARS